MQIAHILLISSMTEFQLNCNSKKDTRNKMGYTVDYLPDKKIVSVKMTGD